MNFNFSLSFHFSEVKTCSMNIMLKMCKEKILLTIYHDSIIYLYPMLQCVLIKYLLSRILVYFI